MEGSEEEVKDALKLAISGAPQFVRTAAEKLILNRMNEIDKIWVVKSETTDDNYLVALRMDGRWVCTCPHYFFRLQSTGGECKHIALVKMHIDEYNPVFDRELMDAGMVASMMWGDSIPDDEIITEGIVSVGGSEDIDIERDNLLENWDILGVVDEKEEDEKEEKEGSEYELF